MFTAAGDFFRGKCSLSPGSILKAVNNFKRQGDVPKGTGQQ